ncbi:hypothetical protein AVEN_84716-1 [Araneus ventricosus]|uniref:Uncharacterized protein n=1 Tax=Araneus ventricosus TaxID=182803 RepID=A0A4Y2UEE9_ARAVE|nr:hypothetical protein AVEN_84716-1 [Araneus ventricosus]
MTRRSQRIANECENPKFSITLLQSTFDFRINDGFWSDANEIALGGLRECPALVLWWRSLESEVLSVCRFVQLTMIQSYEFPPKTTIMSEIKQMV